MEDRIAARPHLDLAVIALLTIGAITAGWWALALWPAGPAPPEWLVRTRAACFGTQGNGLPDAGGWVLLIGQPLGMVGFLMVVWGESVRRGLRRLRRSRSGQLASLGFLVALSGGAVLVVARIHEPEAAVLPTSGGVTALDLPAPDVELVDQRGGLVRLAELGPALLTFGYGHCTTVCPTGVRDLLRSSRTAGSTGLPVIVLTLDPWRDVPERLPSIAAEWGLVVTGRDRVLSGSPETVEQVLDQLGIARRRNPVTGDIDHVTAVMGLDAHGRIQWRRDGQIF